LENKSFLQSNEVLTGVGMIVIGLGMMAAKMHGFVAEAFAPFGVGLILSDGIGRAAKKARQRVPVRRDED
jgi:hypothetical protein